MPRQFTLVVALVAGCSSLAHAQRVDAPPRARLAYRAPAECPNEGALRDRVAARLGYDPFADEAATELRVEVDPSRDGYSARAQIGGSRRARRLGPLASCVELLQTTAVVVSILLDPLHEPTGSPVPSRTDDASSASTGGPASSTERTSATSTASTERTPATSTASTDRSPAATAASTERSTRASRSASSERSVDAATSSADEGIALSPRLDVDAGAAVGSAPAPAFAADVAAGLGIGDAFRLLAGARLRHTLVDVDVNGEGVRVATYAGTLAGCVQVSVVVGCFDVELGAHVADAGRVAPSRNALHASSGVRIGVEWTIAPGIALRALLGAWVPWFQLRLIRDGRPAWEAPPVIGALTLGVGIAP